MKGLRTMIVSALVIALMLSSVGSALAAGPPKNTTNIFGKVIAVERVSSTDGFIDLEAKSDEIVKIKADKNTQYKNGSFIDITVGKRLAVVTDEIKGTLIAKQILIEPTEPTYKHLVGVVTSVSGTTVNVGDKQGNTFAFDAKPMLVAPAIKIDKIEPGQRVTAVVHKDLRLMKRMSVRIAPAGTEEAEASTETTGRVTFVEVSPELVKEICIEAPPQLRREVFIDLPPEQVKEIWMNMPPELAREIWLNLPPELAKEIWLSLPEKVKEIWIDLPPQLATEEVWLDINSEQLKQIWLEMPPQLAKEIWMNLPPQLAKEVWLDIAPEQLKQIWMNLPAKNVKEIWIDMPVPEATEAPPGVESVIQVKPVPPKDTNEREKESNKK